jgi:hypothetical protein
MDPSNTPRESIPRNVPPDINLSEAHIIANRSQVPIIKQPRKRKWWSIFLVLGITTIMSIGIVKETKYLNYRTVSLALQSEPSSLQTPVKAKEVHVPVEQPQITKAKEFEKELLETRTKKKPDIAIISSYVSSSQWAGTPTRLDERSLDQLVNKACYAKRWGYEFIFNMTYGFIPEQDNPKGNAYWQEYGAWSRVPHIRDRIEDYKWVLYADIDFIIANMSFPMEQFLHEWESYNKTPSVFVPKDEVNANLFTFSDFAVLIQNSPFGRGVLDHWMDFARGVCEKGNFASGPRPYTWSKCSMWIRNLSEKIVSPFDSRSHYPPSI